MELNFFYLNLYPICGFFRRSHSTLANYCDFSHDSNTQEMEEMLRSALNCAILHDCKELSNTCSTSSAKQAVEQSELADRHFCWLEYFCKSCIQTASFNGRTGAHFARNS